MKLIAKNDFDHYNNNIRFCLEKIKSTKDSRLVIASYVHRLVSRTFSRFFFIVRGRCVCLAALDPTEL